MEAKLNNTPIEKKNYVESQKHVTALNLWIHEINMKEKEEEKSGLKGLLVL